MRKDKTNRGMFSFFTTVRGRKVVFAGACVTTMGLFAGNFIPHTLGLRWYRDIWQCYRNGEEVPVSEKVKERLSVACENLNLSSYHKLLIKPFTVFGFDIFQAGSTQYRFGGALGIPSNYCYEKIEDINKNDIRFRNNSIDWNSEAGRTLQEALILTEDEQIFGLSKAILQLETHWILMNSIFPAVSFLTVYSVGSALNLKLNLFARPLSLRIVLYSILGLFGFGVWSFLKDYNQVQYDSEIDKKLSSLGPEFIIAGISFYEKILKKNIALRNLLGDDTYTVKGNENYLLRQKALPITIRKSFFEMKLKELHDLKESLKEPELA